MKKIYFDEISGRVLAWIDPSIEVVNASIPAAQIADITQEQWELKKFDHVYWVGGELVSMPAPPSAWHVIEKGRWVIDAPKQAQALEALKISAIARIGVLHGEAVERLVGNPTQAEKDTWNLKLETAKAITAKTAISATGAAFLVAAGISTDAAKADWAARVLANADNYAKAVGVCEKWRTDARAAVRAAANHPDLQTAEATALQAVLNIK